MADLVLMAPAIRPIQIFSGDQVEWRWELLERWEYLVRRVSGSSVDLVRRVIEPGFRWDGSTKPLHNKAIFVTASSHWSMVVPSMEHDELCNNRVEVKAMGITSADAAWHFYQQCLAYKTGYAWAQWKAVLWGGPQW